MSQAPAGGQNAPVRGDRAHRGRDRFVTRTGQRHSVPAVEAAAVQRDGAGAGGADRVGHALDPEGHAPARVSGTLHPSLVRQRIRLPRRAEHQVDEPGRRAGCHVRVAQVDVAVGQALPDRPGRVDQVRRRPARSAGAGDPQILLVARREPEAVRPVGTRQSSGDRAAANRFERLVADSGLPPIRLHDLRHCAATLLKASGSDLKDIQEVLGLSSITVAANTYTSVMHELESDRAKAEAASALVPRRSGAAIGTSAGHPQENASGGPPGTRTPNLRIESPHGLDIPNLKQRPHLRKRRSTLSSVELGCPVGDRMLAISRYLGRERPRVQLRRATAQLGRNPGARAYGGALSCVSPPRAHSICYAQSGA